MCTNVDIAVLNQNKLTDPFYEIVFFLYALVWTILILEIALVFLSGSYLLLDFCLSESYLPLDICLSGSDLPLDFCSSGFYLDFCLS